MAVTLHRVRNGATYAGETDLKVMTCPVCGVVYAIPARLQENAYDRGHGEIQWFCCNGHQLGYHGKSEAEIAREKTEAALVREQATRDLLAHTERSLRSQKGATTKAKKRHASGVCPCCERSFVQLRRHMAAKHADYLAEHGIEPETSALSEEGKP